jgi:hypothetical protein
LIDAEDDTVQEVSFLRAGIRQSGERKGLMTEDFQLTCSDGGRQFTFSSEDEAFFPTVVGDDFRV